MACDKSLLAQAYLDGELDPAAVLEIEAHLGTCASCQRLVADTKTLREALAGVPARHAPPRDLAARIHKALDSVDAEATGTPGWLAGLRRFAASRRQWLTGALSGAVAAGAVAAALVMLAPSDDDQRVVDELANAHLRSLMAQHLLDVSSSDGTTVAPWFKSKVDVAPPVIDLSAQGFDLEGGRADFVDGRRVAAIVYRSGNHVVNLFVWSDYEIDHASSAERDGYTLFMWPQRNLALCAVSDMSVNELKTLARSVNAGMAAAASK